MTRFICVWARPSLRVVTLSVVRFLKWTLVDYYHLPAKLRTVPLYLIH